MDEQIYSILGVSTLRSQHGCNTPGHALNEIDARLLWDIHPLALYTPPQLIDVGRCGFGFGELLLEVSVTAADRKVEERPRSVLQ